MQFDIVPLGSLMGWCTMKMGLYHISAEGGFAVTNKDIKLICGFLDELSDTTDEAALNALIDRYISGLGSKDTEALRQKLYLAGVRMLERDDETMEAVRTRRIASLTENEKTELEKVDDIISGNKLLYYFQPIVSAVDGEIFSYEALMRSATDPAITPYHILKYAELTDRLSDVEKATFLNVLSIIEDKKDVLAGKSVFINSMPNVMLSTADAEKVCELLERNADTAVVEMTENAEADDAQLKRLKDLYRSMNVRIAVDDYGTGYSNVGSLLRYTPNFVKIDRSLLSEIDSQSKKRHLVRDIIEFCHDNKIFALAEGVETSEELKTVILMGVDLIQGYYTARPSPEIIESIPFNIKEEIRRYQQERQDGKATHVYTPAAGERVMLEKLKKMGYKCIHIKKYEGNSDVTIVGLPSLDTHIRIEVDSGYEGKISIESAHLSGGKNRPTIIIGECCKVELAMFGDNVFHRGGILVPESSELTLTGLGALFMSLTDTTYYGIGAEYNKRHGKLLFDANVEFVIEAHGNLGVCIGSGLGGEIIIRRGIFTLNINGNKGVGIGSLYGDDAIDISNCGMDMDVNLTRGVLVGSMDGNADVYLHELSFNSFVGGQEMVCAGTVSGDKADIKISNAHFGTNVRSDKLAVMGALYGDTAIDVVNVSISVSASGYKAYALGGIKGSTRAYLENADTQIKLKTEMDGFTSASGDDLTIKDSRFLVTVNGEELKFEQE